MTNNDNNNNSNLDHSFCDFYNRINANYIVNIRAWKNIESLEVTKFNIAITNNKTKKNNSFNISNEDELDFNAKIKNILIKAIDLKFIDKESTAAFVFDRSFSNDYSLGIIVVEVSRILYRIARFKLTEFLENELVLEKILNIAQEIKNEGREGKTIGTMFIIGDELELQPYLRPLVLNPFYGYPEEMRDLLNIDLSETIKEYAQLDGAFIISNKGIVISAGTYVDVNTDNVKKYYGWGTKHLTAASITQKTKSVVVLLSESGNVIKIFKNGKLILKF